MSLSDEFKRLEALDTSGTLTDAEFQQAKAAVLTNASGAQNVESDTQSMNAKLGDIKFQNELARLDREWLAERESYMQTGQYGERYLPTRGLGITAAIVVSVIGIIWTISASQMSGSDAFTAFGVIVAGCGLAYGILTFIKAGHYADALKHYESRRAKLIVEHEHEKESDHSG